MIYIQGQSLQIKQAVRNGYVDIPLVGGGMYVVDVSYPKSKLRRGRAQGNPKGSICPALTCGVENSLYVFEEI